MWRPQVFPEPIMAKTNFKFIHHSYYYIVILHLLVLSLLLSGQAQAQNGSYRPYRPISNIFGSLFRPGAGPGPPIPPRQQRSHGGPAGSSVGQATAGSEGGAGGPGPADGPATETSEAELQNSAQFGGSNAIIAPNGQRSSPSPTQGPSKLPPPPPPPPSVPQAPRVPSGPPPLPLPHRRNPPPQRRPHPVSAIRFLYLHCTAQCWNFRILLSFRFLVKLTLENLKVLKLPFLLFFGLWILFIWKISTSKHAKNA